MTYETSIDPSLDGAEILDIPPDVIDPVELQYLLSQNISVMTRMLAYLKTIKIDPSTLFAGIAVEFGEILAGQGGDYILEVTSSAIIARHKDTVYPGPSAAPYTTALRTGLIITANGIAMGYNDKTTGVFTNAVAISSAGNISILGTLMAGSVISNTVTIDGTQAVTVKNNAATGSNHAGVSGTNPHNTPMSTILGDLDDINDGSTYFKSTASQNTGGTRAVNALNSTYDYIRGISTTRIIISEVAPTNGVVIDATGLRGYSGGAVKFEINTSGNATFSGNITGASGTFSGNLVTAGHMYASGAYSGRFYTASIQAEPTDSTQRGVVGVSSGTGVGTTGLTQTGYGTQGAALAAGGIGVHASSSSDAQIALAIPVGYITRPKSSLNGRLEVWDVATNTSQGIFWYEFRA